MKELIQKVGNNWVNKGIIKAEDKDLYTYGIYQGIIIIFNFTTSIIIGICFGLLLESILFLFAYIPIRSNAGGHHAKSQIVCYVVSSIITIIVLMIIKFNIITNLIGVMALIISSLIICLLAPVEDANKPFDKAEKKVYKKRTQKILGILIIIALLSLSLAISKVFVCIVLAIVTLSIMLILGKSDI